MSGGSNMEKTYRLFVINPGSTSTRVAYYENEKEVCGTKLVHPAEEIAKYKTCLLYTSTPAKNLLC